VKTSTPRTRKDPTFKFLKITLEETDKTMHVKDGKVTHFPLVAITMGY
jgi:hypothetical protein